MLLLAPTVCCLLAFAASAQAPGPTPAPTPGTATPPAGRGGGEHVVRGTCQPDASRELFAACDADGDDRLDVFEASASLDGVRAPNDHDGFGRFDRDRDGYLTWPEFDAALQQTLRRGAPFRVRTLRAVATPAPRTAATSPVLQFLQLHDANQNGALDPAEIDTFLAQSRLPAAFAKQLRALDADQSGRLEPAELLPWVSLLGVGTRRDARTTDAAALPAPWASADRDGSGTIDVEELRVVLRRLDGTLAAWAEQLLRALDRDRDGALGPDELPAGGGNDGDGAPANGVGQLPLRAPVR
jgi:Ca2+-binding EF-hand superfamily protein